MDDATLQLRGQIVDELHQRMNDLNAAAQPVPAEWREKLIAVSETTEADIVNLTSAWLDALPPREYKTAEVSWQTFNSFNQDALDKVTLAATRKLLTGADHSAEVQALKDMMAIRDTSGTPQEALQKLAVIQQTDAVQAVDNIITVASADQAVEAQVQSSEVKG